MSYTSEWSNSAPLGSEAAKHIDDIFRDLKLDITERMNELVVDWTSDPVVPLVNSSGVNKVILIPHTSFITSVVAGIPTYYNDHLALAPDTAAKASIILPQYSRIKGISFLGSKNDCTSINYQLVKVVFTSALTTTFPLSITSTASGYTKVDSVALDIEVDGFATYHIFATASGGTSFFVAGASVLYST